MTVNQIDKLEKFVYNGTAYVLDEYFMFTYNANFTHFDVISGYDNTSTLTVTIQFTGWDGKRNPYFGRIGEFMIGMGHYFQFDNWMAQNPTGYTITPVTGPPTNGTVTYNNYNADNFPTDLDITVGGTSINHTYTYNCY